MNSEHPHQTPASNGEESTTLVEQIEAAPSAKKPKSHALVVEEWLGKHAEQGTPKGLLPQACEKLLDCIELSLGLDRAAGLAFMLPTLAAAIGKSAKLQLNQGHLEPAILWSVLSAPSGASKSPALEASIAPLQTMDRALGEVYKAELEAYETKVREAKNDKKASTPSSIEKPKRDHAIVRSGTLEGLAKASSESQGSLVAFDELTTLIKGLNQYKSAGGNDEQVLLSLYNGAPFKKVNTSETVESEATCLSITGGIQPEVLRKTLAQDTGNGFFARFDFVSVQGGARPYLDGGFPPSVTEAYSDCVQAIRDKSEKERVIPLDKDALQLFAKFHDEAKELTLQSNEKGASFLGKLAGKAAKLALIVTLAHHPKAKIVRKEYMQHGIQLATWLLLQTIDSYSLAGVKLFSGLSARAETLKAWLVSKGMEASESEVKRGPSAFRGNAGAALLAIQELIDAGEAERVPSSTFSSQQSSATIRLLPDAGASKSA